MRAAIAQTRSLKRCWQERRAVVLGSAVVERGTQTQEAGQVLVLAAQPVEGPRPKARSSEDTAARVDIEQRWPVRNEIGSVHRADHCDVVDATADVRKEVADFNAAVTVLPELPRRCQQVAGPSKLELRFGERQWLAIHLCEFRLRVERVNMRHPAVHEQEDDPLRSGGEVRQPGSERPGCHGK